MLCTCPILLLFLLVSCQKGQSKEEVVNLEQQTTVKETAPIATTSPTPQVQPKEDVTLKKPTELDDQFSYTYGYMLFSALKSQGFSSLDGAYFSQGVLDAAEQKTSYFTQSEMESILKQVQGKMLEKAKSEYAALAERNKKEAVDFLETNRKVPGVVTLEDGLQYQVIVPGDVDVNITKADTARIDYVLTTLDGTVLRSTYKIGHSEEVSVADLTYHLLEEGLLLMHPNSKFRFWIPPELAYGEEGSDYVGPNELLIVEVEVHQVTKTANDLAS